MTFKIRKPCTIDGCDRPCSKRGLCNMHYLRQYRHGTTDKRRFRPQCTIEGCAQLAKGRGLCGAHYFRWYSNSPKTGPVENKPSQGPLTELPNHMTREQWVMYAAGFFDGEGSICLIRRKVNGKLHRAHVLSASAQQVNPAPLRILQSLFGGYVIDPKHKSIRPCFSWRVCARRAVAAINEMHPYLIVKREQAELALQFAETVKGPRTITDELLDFREGICKQIASYKYRTYSL